jgi:wyosine [tRNA(Phe)-imidazoG37] synthetase (radical SAM superfamily)
VRTVRRDIQPISMVTDLFVKECHVRGEDEITADTFVITSGSTTKMLASIKEPFDHVAPTIQAVA